MLIKSGNTQEVLNDSDFENPTLLGKISMSSSVFASDCGEIRYSTTYTLSFGHPYPNVTRIMYAELKSELDELTGKDVNVGKWQYASSFTLLSADISEAVMWRNEVKCIAHRLMLSAANKVIEAEKAFEDDCSYEVYTVN